MIVLRHFSVTGHRLEVSLSKRAFIEQSNYLESRKHGMCLANYADNDRTLLYSFLSILHLEDATLRRAIKQLAEPGWDTMRITM